MRWNIDLVGRVDVITNVVWNGSQYVMSVWRVRI